jgi:demethylmenaquinone methyltransferase/2-methoxy-6-polyprenyl-1,4-benzoquinol methylase
MTQAKKKTKTTHFGYQEVSWEEKENKVAGVFDSVADKYDLMNDVMSLGIHRWWKRYALMLSGAREGQQILDLAGGTGDLTIGFSKAVGSKGSVILADINNAMLSQGRDRLIDLGLWNNVSYVQLNAEALSFRDNQFDCICIGFGLRNVTDKLAALRSMYRVLKPGGRVLILEFSKPTSDVLQKLYDLYSFILLPQMGKWIADDEASYRYLAESIRMHPDQESLKKLLEEAEFEDVSYQNLSNGIVAIHCGYKY